MWDFESQKVREVSFSFCVVSEGCFPFKGRKKEYEGDPLSFFPTLEAFLTPDEWKKYKFSPGQQLDLMKRKGLVSTPLPPQGRRGK